MAPRLRSKPVLIEWLVFGALGLVVMSPWLFKNLFMAGNPVYPLAFPGAELDPWRQTFQTGPNPLRTISNDILLPFEVTFFGIEGAVVEGKLEYGASVGPLMIALVPGLLLGWGRFQAQQRSSLIRLLVVAIGVWVIWSINAHIAEALMWPRHYYGAFPALAILAVAGFEAASAVVVKQLRVNTVLASLVALTLVLAAYAEWVKFVDDNPLAVLAGKQSQADYVAQELGWYGLAIQGINALPSGSRVLFLWEPRTLYCRDVRCYPDGTLHNWWYLQGAYADILEIREALCQEEVNHVLVNELGRVVAGDMPNNYDFEDWVALEQFKRKYLEMVASYGDSYALYRVDCSLRAP